MSSLKSQQGEQEVYLISWDDSNIVILQQLLVTSQLLLLLLSTANVPTCQRNGDLQRISVFDLFASAITTPDILCSFFCCSEVPLIGASSVILLLEPPDKRHLGFSLSSLCNEKLTIPLHIHMHSKVINHLMGETANIFLIHH